MVFAEVEYLKWRMSGKGRFVVKLKRSFPSCGSVEDTKEGSAMNAKTVIYAWPNHIEVFKPCSRTDMPHLAKPALGGGITKAPSLASAFGHRLSIAVAQTHRSAQPVFVQAIHTTTKKHPTTRLHYQAVKLPGPYAACPRCLRSDSNQDDMRYTADFGQSSGLASAEYQPFIPAPANHSKWHVRSPASYTERIGDDR